MRDTVIQECIQFLDHCEIYGRNVKTVIEQPLEAVPIHAGKNDLSNIVPHNEDKVWVKIF